MKLLNIPVVQEVNEWYPGKMEWINKLFCLFLSNGTIAISKMIEERLSMLCSKYKISNKVLRIPVLMVVENSYQFKSARVPAVSDTPYILWCGNIQGYMRDIKFMIRSHYCAEKLGCGCNLTLVGKINANTRKEVENYIRTIGLNKKYVHFTGYVSNDELKLLMHNARALLLPLWDDDRSRCRYPTKLAEYLLSETPIITCSIGDLSDYLVDNLSAFFYPPGDERKLSEKIWEILNNPEFANSVGRQGRLQAKKCLDYRSKSQILSDFFCENAR